MSAVAQAKKSLGDLVITVPVSRKSNGTYNPITLTVTQEETTSNVDGFVGEWTEDELRGEIVRHDDIKFYVFPTAVVIKHGDTVNYEDSDYEVVRISPIKAGTQTALTMLQLRK